LPRSAFLVKGSADFRKWLFSQSTVQRIDFLVNSRRWMFDAHAQYTVALLNALARPPHHGRSIAVAGVAESERDFLAQSEGAGLTLEISALGPELEIPLLRSQDEADLLAKLRRTSPFPLGSGRWKAFPVQELNETFDRALWLGKRDGWPLWKGDSFDQYDPHGAEERYCPPSDAAMRKVWKPNAGKESLVARDVPLAARATAVKDEVGRARVAFRDVANRLNLRTVIACLVPPETFLTNKAPYLVFVDGDDQTRAAALALLNSLPFDWQARRVIERNLNFFLLEGLCVPEFTEENFEAVAKAAARLSCADERFAGFAAANGVDVGPLDAAERERLRAEIDARVAYAWGLDDDDLETIFADFTLDAVPEPHRQRIRDRFAELAST
jgi:hypothetical protein